MKVLGITLACVVLTACGSSGKEKKRGGSSDNLTSGEQVATSGSDSNQNPNGSSTNALQVIIVSPWSSSAQNYGVFTVAQNADTSLASLQQMTQNSVPQQTSVTFGCLPSNQNTQVDVNYGTNPNGGWGVDVGTNGGKYGYNNYGCLDLNNQRFTFTSAIGNSSGNVSVNGGYTYNGGYQTNVNTDDRAYYIYK